MNFNNFEPKCGNTPKIYTNHDKFETEKTEISGKIKR